MTTDTTAQKIRLLRMPLKHEQDVVLCRNRARFIAEALKVNHQDQVRIATAVSEIARNAFRYAREASAEFYVATNRKIAVDKRPTQWLVITIQDRGPGIKKLSEILGGTYKSETGMGLGILGAKRLLDGVNIHTGPEGTTVELMQQLPGNAALLPGVVQAVVDEISRKAVPSPLEELATQNQELILALDTLRNQEGQLETINEELSETNRGVVALYDELDTVYRVGRVVAAKLELDSLLDSITTATTEISGAELGAFFLKNDKTGLMECQAVSGPQGISLRDSPALEISRLMGSSGDEQEIFHIDDLASEQYHPPFEEHVHIRSYLALAVRDSEGTFVGALVYGHRLPSMFTERTERILTSVAVQASIGIENARLYRNVQVASAAKDQFLAILSHELRTPLSPVFSILGMLDQRDDLPLDVHADIAIMRRNLQLEARLIDDLLDLTRIVKGKIPLQREVTDVHTLLRAVCETCQAEISAKGVHVHMEVLAERSHVSGDAARLQQVFWNVLSNAVKFTPKGGDIFIRSKVVSGADLCIEITDTGRGIEVAALQKIFHPFEQGDTAIPAQFGGLGLGLAISKSIVEAHGGRIRAESTGMNNGASLFVSLPLATSPENAPSTTSTPLSTKEPKATRILLVDDHDDTRNMFARVLARCGHVVTTAPNCREAIDIGINQDIDVLISDLGLPDGTGHDIMREISKHRPIKGIALSGFGMESDVDRSREAGFSMHLTKPVEFTALRDAIEQVLNE